MRKFSTISNSPERVEVYDWHERFRKEYAPTLTDKTFFRPMADLVNAMEIKLGDANVPNFHFEDGKDDGRTLDTLPATGLDADIGVLYQKTIRLEKELTSMIDEAKAAKASEDAYRNFLSASAESASETSGKEQ